MATVNCPKCDRRFNPTNHLATGGAMAAGAAAGAGLGAGIGIAGGPFGAIAGTVPGALVGAALAGMGVTKVARCPQCSSLFVI